MKQQELKTLLNGMTAEERKAFENFIKISDKKKNGQYTVATWRSDLTPLASYKEEMKGVGKISTSVVRFGINYKNIKGVVLSENNTREPWYDVIIPNILIQHKTTKEYYIRLYIGKTKAKTKKYYVNGNGEVLNDIDLNKFRKSSSNEKLECFYIKLRNLISLK